MTQAELIEAAQDRRRAGADRDRPDRPRGAGRRPGPQLKLIANFGTGVDNIDLDAARSRGIIVTNTPGVLTEDTADMTMALILAVPRRLAEGAAALKDPRQHWNGWSPTWMLGHRICGKRLGIIGMGRIGQAVARRARAFGLQVHYHNRRRLRRGDRAGARGDLLGQPRPDAGAHGHRLDQLPAHARDLSPAVGAAAEAAEADGLHRQHRARRGDRRERAGPPDRGRRDRRRRPRRVRARAGDQPEAARRSSRRGRCCRTWARRRSRAASTWARRSSSTSRPSSTATTPPDRVHPAMLMGTVQVICPGNRSRSNPAFDFGHRPGQCRAPLNSERGTRPHRACPPEETEPMKMTRRVAVALPLAMTALAGTALAQKADQGRRAAAAVGPGRALRRAGAQGRADVRAGAQCRGRRARPQDRAGRARQQGDARRGRARLARDDPEGERRLPGRHADLGGRPGGLDDRQGEQDHPDRADPEDGSARRRRRTCIPTSSAPPPTPRSRAAPRPS